MTKEEVFKFQESKKAKYVQDHITVLSSGQRCSSVTEKEYLSMPFKCKRATAMRHTRNAYWRYRNVTIKELLIKY
jgi:hypothetical protein